MLRNTQHVAFAQQTVAGGAPESAESAKIRSLRVSGGNGLSLLRRAFLAAIFTKRAGKAAFLLPESLVAIMDGPEASKGIWL
jgi:hypothetical protein